MKEKYQEFRDREGEDWEKFKLGIATTKGNVYPIMVDEEAHIIDGHQRMRACLQLGLTPYTEVVEGYTEEQKKEMAFVLNAHNRQLTPAEKEYVVKKFHELFPEKTQREIGEALHMSKSQVNRILVPNGTKPATPTETSAPVETVETKIKKAKEKSPDKSNRKIADEVGVSHTQVNKVLKAEEVAPDITDYMKPISEKSEKAEEVAPDITDCLRPVIEPSEKAESSGEKLEGIAYNYEGCLSLFPMLENISKKFISETEEELGKDDGKLKVYLSLQEFTSLIHAAKCMGNVEVAIGEEDEIERLRKENEELKQKVQELEEVAEQDYEIQQSNIEECEEYAETQKNLMYGFKDVARKASDVIKAWNDFSRLNKEMGKVLNGATFESREDETTINKWLDTIKTLGIRMEEMLNSKKKAQDEFDKVYKPK